MKNYSDLKLLRIKTLHRFNVAASNANKDFDSCIIDDKLFDFLYDNSFLPSLFMKPLRFADESELRIVFELPNDVPGHVRISDKRLLEQIEIVS